MKKFTIITKDGSRCLRPVNPFDENGQAWRGFQSSNPDLPYIGYRPEGTVLDESQVRKITQVEDYPEWITPHPDNLEDWLDTSHEIRTVYVDAEPECPECGKYCSCPEEDLYDAVADYRINHPEPSHDRHISDNPRYLLFKHMIDEHGLTLLDSEMDEISHACKLLTGADYWKQRALAAEKLIEMEPSDPKTYDEFCRLRNEWHELKNQEPK